MKGKIVALIVMISAASILLSTVAADPQFTGQIVARAYTTDTQYMPGQTGTLYIVVLNYRSSPVEIKNITIYYPWLNYAKDKGWTGNDTIIPSSTEKTLSSDGGKFEKEIQFTIPNDGSIIHGVFSTADVTVYDKDGNEVASTEAYIVVAVPTSYLAIQDVDKLTTLFTVQVILLIVCTIIIAATIFLAGHRPQLTWRREEEKAE
jgi:hypothetical protein